MHAYRSHTCAGLNKTNVGDSVRLSGWVHRIRDHGGVLFIDLRDHYGITQVLCDPDSPVFSEMEKVRSEWCIRIDGNVKARDESLVNPKIPTGEIEVFVRDLEVLGASEELPLIVFGDQEYPEETRLKYRYLDLRREVMQKNMTLRSDVIASIRKRMWDLDFREYQTPIITASSPEGARDFWCHQGCIRGNFTHYHKLHNNLNSSLWFRGLISIFKSHLVSEMKILVQIARLQISINLIWK